MAKNAMVPELIVSSDALRASQTAQAVAQACGYTKEIVFLPRLYLAEPSTYLQVLLEIPPETPSVLMVGHNPGISILASQLTNQEVSMPTAALARVEFAIDHFADIDETTQGRLTGFWTPEELERSL